MTTQEAKYKLYMQWQEYLEHNIDYAGISDAYKMAFKALEQMNVLDKIRAEISEYKDNKIIHAERNEMIDIMLALIDKYRNEVNK